MKNEHICQEDNKISLFLTDPTDTDLVYSLSFSSIFVILLSSCRHFVSLFIWGNFPVSASPLADVRAETETTEASTFARSHRDTSSEGREGKGLFNSPRQMSGLVLSWDAVSLPQRLISVRLDFGCVSTFHDWFVMHYVVSTDPRNTNIFYWNSQIPTRFVRWFFFSGTLL